MIWLIIFLALWLAGVLIGWCMGAFGWPLVNEQWKHLWVSDRENKQLGYCVRWFFLPMLWPLTGPMYFANKKGSLMLELGNKSKELDAINQKILHAAANLAAIKDQIADAKSERTNVLNLDKRRGLKN